MYMSVFMLTRYIFIYIHLCICIQRSAPAVRHQKQLEPDEKYWCEDRNPSCPSMGFVTTNARNPWAMTSLHAGCFSYRGLWTYRKSLGFQLTDE